VNPGSLICARLLTSDAKADIDTDWWVSRFRRAFALRDEIYPTPHYRAIYGESDGAPGLVVDRYGDVLVAQLNTAGIVNMRGCVVEALQAAARHPPSQRGLGAAN
jgi:23S rRNA (cytosine1962-C5)-methyltransferase